MNLKKMALFTLVVSQLVIYLFIIYNIPLVYTPSDATAAEYVIYSIACILVEASILYFLFIHMFITSKIQLEQCLRKMFV